MLILLSLFFFNLKRDLVLLDKIKKNFVNFQNKNLKGRKREHYHEIHNRKN